MRQLTNNEVQSVSGAENHNVMIMDPVALVQTIAYLVVNGDKDGFYKGSIVSGMIGGTGFGGFLGYSAYAGAACVGATVGGAAAGAILGGLAGRAVGTFGVAAYEMITA